MTEAQYKLIDSMFTVLSVTPIHNLYLVQYIPSINPDKGFHSNSTIDPDQNDKTITYTDRVSLFKDISVPITALVNSYARVYLNSLKLDLINQGYSLFYSDTDSLVVDKPLPPHLVGSDIGLFKLEYVIKRGYFISEKLYFLVLSDDSTISVAKGIKTPLTEDDFISLYNGSPVVVPVLHTVKNIELGFVDFKNVPISLSGSYSNRLKVFNSNND